MGSTETSPARCPRRLAARPPAGTPDCWPHLRSPCGLPELHGRRFPAVPAAWSLARSALTARRPGLALGSRRRTGLAGTSAAADPELADSREPGPGQRHHLPPSRTRRSRRWSGLRPRRGQTARAGLRHNRARTPNQPRARGQTGRPARRSRRDRSHRSRRCVRRPRGLNALRCRGSAARGRSCRPCSQRRSAHCRRGRLGQHSCRADGCAAGPRHRRAGYACG